MSPCPGHSGAAPLGEKGCRGHLLLPSAGIAMGKGEEARKTLPKQPQQRENPSVVSTHPSQSSASAPHGNGGSSLGTPLLALPVAQLFPLPSFLLLKVLPQGFPGSVCS